MTRQASEEPHHYRGAPGRKTRRNPCIGCGRPQDDPIHVVPVDPGGGTLARLGLTLAEHQARAERRRRARADDRRRRGLPPLGGGPGGVA